MDIDTALRALTVLEAPLGLLVVTMKLLARGQAGGTAYISTSPECHE